MGLPLSKRRDAQIAPDLRIAGLERTANGRALLDDYDLGEVLGEGAFGVVYLCTPKGSSEKFAVKMIDKVETEFSSIQNEVDMLMLLKHPRVVSLHNVYYEKVFVCMVMDCIRGGDMIEGMSNHWQAKGMIPQKRLKNILKQMVESVAWLHSNRVAHRDIKGDNYLMDRKDIADPDCKFFLSDFGTVKKVKPGERLSDKCGTKMYWAPEFYLLNYGLKVDVWAIGVILYGLIGGKFPFNDEHDVHNKKVKVARGTEKELGELVLQMLEKAESDRIDSSAVLKSSWLQSVVQTDQTVSEGEQTCFKAEVRERGATKGVGDRRRQLVERLQVMQAGKNGVGAVWHSIASPPLAEKEAQDEFVVENKRSGHKKLLQWWSKDKVESSGLLKLDACSPATEELSGGSFEAIKALLESNKVDTSKFGTHNTKTLREFVDEVQRGATRLMIDAAKHKTLVRVLDLVLLRIVFDDDKQKMILLRTKEFAPNGQVRESRTQMEGTKRAPYENTLETARRIAQERLMLVDVNLRFDVSNIETFEEQAESHSYPGVRTVYRKSIVEARIPAGVELSRLGLSDNKGLVTMDSSGIRREYAWFTEADCADMKMKLSVPSSEQEMSALVDPAMVANDEEVRSLLEKGGVDTSRFGKDGAKTLREFVDELSCGESSVELQNNVLVRIVDVVAVTVYRPRDGSMLVETKQMSEPVKHMMRLPAVKRRPDENVFLAAQRCLMKSLGMDINEVSMKHDEVVMMTEVKESPSYPGVKTFYRKRIISCALVGVA